ncbi:MAG: glucose PTS transporter subunit IIA [Treponema sp.]|nr:glucose PTS transporter subunit IIA [Treponema sp.]
MAKDFSKTALGVLTGIGGKENVRSVVHCATRLRFTLADNAKANDEAVKGVSGVVSVVKAGGLYQVVIGNDVHEVYEELEKLGVQSGGTALMDGGGGKQNLGNMLVGTISGVFGPILAALMGIGMLKGLIALLSQIFPTWATSGDMSYIVLYAAGDALMYFLPIMVAYTAAQKFKLDPLIGMVIGATLVYPDIVAKYPFGPWGVHKFLGLDILVLVRYSGTVLPSIIAVWCAAKMYKHFRKALPSAVKNFLAPFFTLLVMIPATFLVVGPVFGIAGLGIQMGVQSISNIQWVGPIVLGVVLGFFWQVLVIFGLHWAVVPIAIAEYSTINAIWGAPVSVLFGAIGPAPFAMTGAVFGMALKIKNAERRSAATAAGIAGIFGITEPIIYGFTLPKKKPFFQSCAVAAVFSGLAEFSANFISDGHGFAALPGAMGVFSFPSMFIPGFTGSTANFLIGVISITAATLATMFLVAATYKPDAAELKTDKAVAIDTSKVNVAAAKKIYAPVKGRVMPINQSADPAHQEEALGKGVCFMPLGGKIYAPFDGTIEMVFDTKHAINIKSADGIEALIHCGIDTVKLGGKGFATHVQEGAKVKAGDLLFEYDKDVIARSGYNLETQLVITNTGDYKAITQAKAGDCLVGDVVLYVE